MFGVFLFVYFWQNGEDVCVHLMFSVGNLSGRRRMDGLGDGKDGLEKNDTYYL
jgi:hypothetical protein